MTVGTLLVVLGWLGAGGAWWPWYIGPGVGLALFGYLLDWRSESRAVIGVGIAISWLSVYLMAALVVGVVVAAGVRVVRGLASSGHARLPEPGRRTRR